MTVGVVLPVYDGATHVAAAIESVLAQTVADLELVVVDDGSTDGTRAVVRSYDDPRVTLLVNDRNRGVAASRNRGAAAVDGDLLAFIDHDDVWHPDKLARHRERHRTTGADLVYSDVRVVDADGTVVDTVTLPDPAAPGEPLVRQLLFRGGEVIRTMSSVTVRRAAWAAAGGESTAFTVSGDVDLYVRLAGDHRFARVATPLVDKRAHGGNISGDYRAIHADHARLLTRALERYPFLEAADADRKRARMAYRRATSALAAGEAAEAARYARESLRHDRRLRPGLVFSLAAVDRLTGPAALGRRLLRAYERLRGDHAPTARG